MKTHAILRLFWSVPLVALGLILPCAFADGGFALHSGDVVVFYGDSITENELYTNAVETYIVTRFPGLKVRFINSGWTGDTVQGGVGGPIDVRLSRDVVSQNPSMVVVMLGMNDVIFGNPADPKAYAAGMQHIVDYLKGNLPNTRITLLEPSPYDEVTRPAAFGGGYNGYLQQFGDRSRNCPEQRSSLCGREHAPGCRPPSRQYEQPAAGTEHHARSASTLRMVVHCCSRKFS